MSRDREEYSNTDHQCKERWSPITHKWKCYSCKRNNIKIYTNIDRSLYENPDSDSECQIPSKWIFYWSSNHESTIRNHQIHRYEYSGTKKSEFLSNYRKYKISLHLRQITKLLNWFSESKTKKTTRPYSYQSLLHLIILIISIITLYNIVTITKKVINTLANIAHSRLRNHLSNTINRCSSYKCKCYSNKYISNISSSNKIECNRNRSKNQNRSKIWLENKK